MSSSCWFRASGSSLEASSVCVCSNYWGPFKKKKVCQLRWPHNKNCRRMVWNGFITSHPKETVAVKNKETGFFLGFVDLRHPPPCLLRSTPRPGAANSPSNETSVWLLWKLVRRCQMTLYANLHRILSLLSCLEWILGEDDLLCIGSSAMRPQWICRASSAHLSPASVSAVAVCHQMQESTH